MLAGAIFPQLEIGSDPIAIRDYAQAVEDLGFHHLLAYDHVLGASTATGPTGPAPYTRTACSTSRSCSSATWPG